MHNSSSLQFNVSLSLKYLCLLYFFHNCKPNSFNFPLAVDCVDLLFTTTDPLAC